MTDRPTREELGQVPLFAGLPADALQRLAAMSELVTVEPGDTLFAEQEPSKDIYLLLDGQIGLVMHVPPRPDESFVSLGPGDLIGWSSLLGRQRIATARADQPSRLLRLAGSDLLELCETDPDVGYAIMRQAFEAMVDRLHRTRHRLLDVFAKTQS